MTLKEVLTIPLSDPGKWVLTMLIAVLFHPCPAQKITIRGKGLAIIEVLREIRRQAGYRPIYSPRSLEDAPSVDLNFRNAEPRQVLKTCFAGLQLGFTIDDRTIDDRAIVIFRKVDLDASLYVPLEGRVQSADGEPLEAASICVDGVPVQVTGAGGLFNLPVKASRTTLTISFQGYSPQTVCLSNTEFHVINLQPSASVLDHVVVQAYGKTTQRLATSSVTQVQGSEIESLTAGNVLEALEGRVTGMAIRQYNGVPGSAFGVMIRGRRSIAQGTDPLVVVDGVPVVNNDGYMSTIGSGSAQGPMGASMLNGIPPSAIASIEVLKDAAATAIYGSRGANGVLLLTLKPGTAGRLRWGVDVYSGEDRTVKTSPLMNTQEYLGLREEALENDGLKPGPGTLPEGYNWDSTRYTNFQREVIGNVATRQNARIDLSGGDANTVFLLSGNYYKETAVFPGSTADDRISIYGHLHRQSDNRRLRIDLSMLYSWEDNRLPMQDYTYAMYLAPNAPPFRNDAGQPVWSDSGISYLNIPALGNNRYRAGVDNQFNHLQLSYDLLPGLVLRSSLGYYRLQSDEYSQLLIAGQDPATHPTGQTSSSSNTGHSELIEELAEYNRAMGAGKLEALLGVTWQEQQTVYSAQEATGYTSDLLLGTGGGTPTLTPAANSVVYRYEAVFGRLNYILRDRYIATLSGRRDGSSRFGPGNEFGNFWAASAAWIFSAEPFFKNWCGLSFGKLRGSLGTTGNDQIGDNSYAQAYTATTAARGYQGQQGATPTTFANDRLGWEVNYNSELALDLGFLNNKILLSAAGYRDWTVNQLVYISLASQSGLPGVVSNVPADIVNKGLEFSLQTYNWTSRNFHWVSTVTLTVPVNRLRRFPSLVTSLYANSLVVGKSLSVVQGYHYEGVSADSGLFEFRGIGPDGTIDPRALVTGGNLDLRYYGGCNQSFRYKHFQLDLFFEFRGQNGYNPFVILYQSYPPGFQGASMLGNGPVEWLGRWRQPGQHAELQQVTENPNTTAGQRILDYIGSDAQSRDASFIRWKSLSLSYRLPAKSLAALSIRESQVYLRGENLLTYTRFPVTDPETQDPTVLPPTRTIAAGIQLNF